MTNKYFLKKSKEELYQDVTTLFNGLKILKIEGFLEKGKPLNVYHQQWNDSQEEDYMVCAEDKKVIYENKDITISFIVSNKYTSKPIKVTEVHDKFINYITNGETYIQSKYFGMEVRAGFVGDYKPSLVRLHREQSFIMGTITLHKLGKETPIE